MNFEQAAFISEILHYVLVLSVVFFIGVKNYKNIFSLVLKFYIMFFSWGVVTYLFQGCPITLFENFVSKKLYGKPFYPGYEYSDTDFFYLITNTDLYIPMAAVAFIAGVTYKNK